MVSFIAGFVVGAISFAVLFHFYYLRLKAKAAQALSDVESAIKNAVDKKL